jgi:hypothetical protein
LSFPNSARSTAWTTAIAILKGNPVLQREVATWRVWSGLPSDIEPFSVDQAPWLKITPHPDEMGFLTNQDHKANFLLNVELGVGGTDVTDIMDFWSAVEASFYPNTSTARAPLDTRLTAVGIYAVEFIRAGWDVRNTGGIPLTGSGVIKLWYAQRCVYE